MRERILGALARADANEIPSRIHEAVTHRLGLQALGRGRSLGWDLLENPGRVQVQTIDSVCGAIVAQMPWLARQGALPEVVEDAGPLYMTAAQRTVLMVECEGPHREWIEHLLLHLDNKAGRFANLIAAMLARRDQWMRMAVRVNDGSRAEIEQLLANAAREGYEVLERLIPAGDLAIIRREFRDWKQAAEELLTQKGEWRKRVPENRTDLVARWPDGRAEIHSQTASGLLL
jgi:hypothetical protein